jgi:hypothetical protein
MPSAGARSRAASPRAGYQAESRRPRAPRKGRTPPHQGERTLPCGAADWASHLTMSENEFPVGAERIPIIMIVH